MKIFIIWILLVADWNFRYIGSSSLEDVVIIIILAILILLLKSMLKFNYSAEK
jgi:hypothetical protein